MINNLWKLFWKNTPADTETIAEIEKRINARINGWYS